MQGKEYPFCFRSANVLFGLESVFYRGEGCFADDVLYLTSISGGRPFVHAEIDEKVGQKRVPLEYARGYLKSRCGKINVRIFVYGNVAVSLKNAHSTAD